MPWARASSLDRHLECPAASHLPQADRGMWKPGYLIPANSLFLAPAVEVEPKDDAAARWGTEMHSAMSNAPDAADPWLMWMEPHREKLWPSRLGEHEVTVSYDCRTREVELYMSKSEDERTAWKLARGPDCVVGSCDWWAVLPSGEPWIDDLKTGWKQPPVHTPQTLFYLMVRMKHSTGQCNTGRMSITWVPRQTIKPGDPIPTPTREWLQVTKKDLDTFEEQLHWAWVRVMGLNPQARPGAHCLYCPSIQVCDKANG